MSENENAEKGAFFRVKCRSAQICEKDVFFTIISYKGYYFQERFQSKGCTFCNRLNPHDYGFPPASLRGKDNLKEYF